MHRQRLAVVLALAGAVAASVVVAAATAAAAAAAAAAVALGAAGRFVLVAVVEAGRGVEALDAADDGSRVPGRRPCVRSFART